MHKKEEALNFHEIPSTYHWVPDFVYGGIDGAITTFAVVAGVQGASLSVPIILILGFANLFADGFSMSVGKYLSDKSEIDQFNKIRDIEYKHLKEKEAHEKDELRHIFTGLGFTGKELEHAIQTVSSNPDTWVDMMMRYEFNMTLENINPMRGAIATFISFLVIGFVPLVGYLIGPTFNLDQNSSFIFACIATAIALFIVGTVKSKFAMKHWFLSGIETAGIGGLAALISYVIGYLLQNIA